jgi:hypothetical protein
MPTYNMTFTLFLLDPRPFEDWRPVLDEMFGGRFVQDLEYKANGRLRYTNYVFGLVVSCELVESWAEGKVYQLGGNNDNSCRFNTLEEVDVGFHVRQLLVNVGPARIMSFEEYRDESLRREHSARLDDRGSP